MKERANRKAASIAAFLVVLGMAASSAYGSLSVSPVRVVLGDDHDKDVVRIANQESSAKSYEVEIVAWSQTEERREAYAPTDDILAVPPLFSLNPGEEQLLRVGMLVPADADTERSYRMFITELAPPETEKTEKAETSGITMRLQIGIPVFVTPNAAPTSTLEFVKLTQVAEQQVIQFRNSGNTHVKVTEVQYLAPGSIDAVVTPALVYILAGQMAYLPLRASSNKLAGTFSIVTENNGTLHYDLPFTH